MATLLFFDCEFTDLSSSASLISAGFITQSGDQFYAELSDYEENACNDFVKAKVLPLLSLHPISTVGFVSSLTDWLPYFRLSWRFAFVTHCTVHRCRLLECCPNCSQDTWPSVFANRASYPRKIVAMSFCPMCSHALAKAAPIFDGQHETSLSLWHALTTGGLPVNAPSGATIKDYFSVLWTMTRLVRRNGATLRKYVPSIDKSALDDYGLQHRVIEQLSGVSRQAILSAATWLMGDWPWRMAKVCQAANISGQDFSGTAFRNPSWFNDAVRKHLFRHTNWITHEQVRATIAELRASELPISKNALRRRLGITESRAINALLDQRRKGSIDELICMIREYYDTLAHTPASRDQQRTLTRDVLILLLSAFSEKPIEAVCNMALEEIAAILQDTQRKIEEQTTPNLELLVTCLMELSDQYLHGIRPEFLGAVHK